MVDVDLVQQKLGGCGCYQALVYILLSLVYMRGAWHTFGAMFLGAIPDHTCLLPHGQTVNITNETVSAEQCDFVFIKKNQSMKTHCEKWKYSDIIYSSTIVTEWDLVCDKDYLVDLSTTIYMIGTALGAVLLPPLSDKYGRKPLMLICLVIQAGFGFLVAFVNNYVVFTLLRCVVGFLNMGIALCAYVSMTEVFPASHRTLPSIGVQLFWAAGVMFLSLFAYLIRDWRHLEMLISLPNLLTLIYIWFLPESLPWLLSKDKQKDARKVIQWALKLNKLSLSPNDLIKLSESPGSSTTLVSHKNAPTVAVEGLSMGDDVLQDEERENIHTEHDDPDRHAMPVQSSKTSNKSTLGALDLVRSPRMRLYAIVMWYLFFVNSLSYFGISFNTPNLHGNPFLNLFLMGAVEVPAYITCMLVINWGGRRVPVCVFLFICGVTSIAALFVPDSTELGPLKLALVMIGKFGITGSYSTIYLLSAEIFPTAVRNQAVGIASFFENIGSISAPFIVFAARKMPHLPLVLFGALTIIGAGVVLLLPETRHRPLPETVEEIESWGNRPRDR